jgi:hypothetical protein
VSEVEEKNKALVRRFLEARVVGDVDAVEKLLAPDFVNHTKVLPDEEPGRQGEMFGFPRLQELLAEYGDEERSLEQALLEELYSFVGEGWEQEDDITLLTLRRSSTLS